MTTANIPKTATKRMTISVSEALHHALKEQAKFENKTLKDLVTERLENDEYDMMDVNESIARGLHEVKLARQGKITLQPIEKLIGKF